MKRYESYKESGVDWIGKLPSSWALSRAKWNFTNKVDKNHPEEPLLSVTQDKSVIRRDESDINVWNPDSDVSGYKLIEPDDFVISLRSFEGGLELSEIRGIISPAYTVLRASGVNHRYFKYLFKSYPFIFEINKVTTGIRQGKAIPIDDFKEIILPHPSKTEQSSISSYLDRKTALIDSLIAKTERKIALLKEKRTALINQAVTKGLDPYVPMKDSGVEWIGEIPEHWETAKLGWLSTVVRGASPRPAGDKRFFNGEDVNWITVKDITHAGEMYLRHTESKLTKAGAERSRQLRKGTLVLTNSGATLGVPAILEIDGCANDGVLAFLDLNPKIDKFFLAMYLTTLTKLLREQQAGYGQPNLNTEIARSLVIPIPPLEEQKEITEKIKSEIKISQSVLRLDSQKVERLKEYRQALISEVVTGKIKVTEDV